MFPRMNSNSDRSSEQYQYKDPIYTSLAPGNTIRITSNDFQYSPEYAYYPLDNTFPVHPFSTSAMSHGYTSTEGSTISSSLSSTDSSNVNPNIIATQYGPPTVSPTQVERSSHSPASQQSSPMSNSDDELPGEQYGYNTSQGQFPRPYEEHELEPAIEALKQKVESRSAQPRDFDPFIESVAYPNKANTGPGSRGGNQGHKCIYPKCTSKMFRRRDRARHHVELHFDAKLEICGICGKGFTRRYDANRHERSCKHASGSSNASRIPTTPRTRGYNKSVRESCPDHSGSFCLVCRDRGEDSSAVICFRRIYGAVAVAIVISYSIRYHFTGG